MISVKATRLPEGFRFADAAKEIWLVFYFTPVTEEKTKITVVGLGYTETEGARMMRSLFAGTHMHTLEMLREGLKKKFAKNQ